MSRKRSKAWVQKYRALKVDLDMAREKNRRANEPAMVARMERLVHDDLSRREMVSREKGLGDEFERKRLSCLPEDVDELRYKNLIQGWWTVKHGKGLNHFALENLWQKELARREKNEKKKRGL